MSPLKRSSFDNEIDTLFTKAEAIIPGEIFPDLPYMEHAPNVHEWYRFEHELWGIGEEIRQFVVKNNKKFNAKQIDRIINICLDKRAKRGRQSFLMLLGRKMYSDYANKIIPLLHDADVDGHVIDTLYKMRADQYIELVKPFLNHDKSWIRNKAKKYISL